MEPEVIASIIAASTALAAVLVGPFLTIRASRNHLLGPMRQAWINTLRDTVSEFIAQICIARIYVAPSSSASEEIRRLQSIEDRTRIQSAYQLKEKIALLINPLEDDHQKLLKLVEAAYEAYSTAQDTKGLFAGIRDQTQRILKREWEVVKK